MGKFKQVQQTYLFTKLLNYWGNMVKNYEDDCRDDDFFDVVRNCFDHDKAVELIETVYSKSELEEMGQARSRMCRLDLSDSLDDVFNALWNHAASRDKCRAVLDAIREYMEAECGGEAEDAVSRRFSELKRILKLDDLEAEILVLAYVRDQTCFSWPLRVEDRDKPLLFGPPGTGKTEFVKYLGKALDRRVLVVKGSDILGMYVGQSEQNIAKAFRRAEAERAILFFDEVDGLLQDRSSASHSWEVTQVNELLQQMESFDGIMVAATNFSKNLDPATMRRFTFKLEFGYLDDEGKRSFFERMFKAKLTDGELAELRQLRNLAPGDFRTVRQEQFYLGDAVTNMDRIEALKEECAVKKDGDGSAPIGFAA